MVEKLKEAYQPWDPDTDLINPFAGLESNRQASNFIQQIKALLGRANFEPISEQEIQASLGDSTRLKLNFKIDFSQFNEVFLYNRGATQATETVKKCFGLKQQTIEFTRYYHVFIFISPKRDSDNAREPVLLRLFQNVPKTDLDILFPETKVGLRLIDKILIGVPADLSGAVVISMNRHYISIARLVNWFLFRLA